MQPGIPITLPKTGVQQHQFRYQRGFAQFDQFVKNLHRMLDSVAHSQRQALGERFLMQFQYFGRNFAITGHSKGCHGFWRMQHPAQDRFFIRYFCWLQPERFGWLRVVHCS